MRRPGPRLFLPLAVALALAATPAPGQSDGGGYLFVGYSRIDPDVALSFTDDELTAEGDFAAGNGLGLEFGYRFGRRVALGLDATYAELDVDLTATVFGFDLGFEARDAVEVATVTATLDVYLVADGPVQVFVGAVAGGVGYGNLDLGGLEEFVGDSDLVGDFAYGGRVGLDVGLGDGGWAIRAVARKLLVDTELETDEVEVTAGLDPVVLSLAVGYRF